MRISDWSSDVCSSDLPERRPPRGLPPLLSGATRRSAQTSCSSIPCLRCRCGGRLPAAAFVIPSPALLQGRAVHHQTENLEQHLRSEEHTSELQSLMRISYAVFCLKTKNNTKTT